MAITSGVSMNGCALTGTVGGWPASVRRWLTTAPQAALAGDQIVGLGPSACSLTQPPVRASAPPPEERLLTFTNPQLPAAAFLASDDLLNSAASAVIRSFFSGETVTWMVVQPLGASPSACPPPLPLMH